MFLHDTHLLDKIYFVFIINLIHFHYIYYVFHCFIYYLIIVFLEMPHHCIVPLCTNNSKLPELSFYRLPLHDKKLLQRWLVNIRRVNTNVYEHSRVCSAHFEGGRKQGKDAAPTTFAWTKEPSATRAPPKECSTPVQVTLPILLVLQHLCL